MSNVHQNAIFLDGILAIENYKKYPLLSLALHEVPMSLCIYLCETFLAEKFPLCAL